MQDEYGETALHTASSKGHIDVARYLLEKRSDSEHSKQGETVGCMSMAKINMV